MSTREEKIKEINKILTKYKTDNLNDLIHDDLNYKSKNYKEFNVYNSKIEKALQKVIVKSPKLMISNKIYEPNEKSKSGNLSVILYKDDYSIKKFYFFIRRMEKRIKSIIEEDFEEKLELRSSIRIVDNFYPIFNLSMPYVKVDNNYEFKFHIYNQTNNRINIQDLDSGIYVSFYMMLDSIWVGKTSYGCNWEILQIKAYRPIDFSVCLFDDYDEDNEENNHQNSGDCYHCLYCPNNHVRTRFYTEPINYKQIPDIPPPPLVKNIKKENNNNGEKHKAYVPSINDLLSVKLKPINKK